MISIIIPTLNEEKYLPQLLESLKNQSYRDFEVIVADADSRDKTSEIAKKYGCLVTKGGMPGVGRNNGTKVALGEYLLFLDADAILPKDFLAEIMKEFTKRRLDIASCYSLPITDKKVDFLLYGAANQYLRLVQYFFPHALGCCILVKNQIHRKIKGFNEEIKLAEDIEYVMRAAKVGKFRCLKKSKIPISSRRLDKEGRLKMSLKYVLCEFYLIFINKKIKTDIFRYQFGNFSDIKQPKKPRRFEK